MDWANIIGSIAFAVVFAIGIPLALRKRKKAGPQNMEQLFQHLQTIGVKVSRIEKGADEEKVGVSRGSGQRSEGLIKVSERNIDYVNIISITSQYGVNFSIDYQVRTPSWLGQKKRSKIRMVTKKSSAIRGKVVDIQWKGDDYLSRQLDYDYRLKDGLLQAGVDELKGGIEVLPEPKHEYARVRTAYVLPSSDFFEAIDIIAGHIKSGW